MKSVRRDLAIVGTVAALGAGVVAGSFVGGGTKTVAPQLRPEVAADDAGSKPAGALPPGATGCGAERAAVKHLTDGFTLPSGPPKLMTVDQLAALTAPAVTQDSPRFTSVPAGSLPETTLVEIRDAHVIAAKQEADSDLHIILQSATGAEMNVESPAASCDSSSPYAGVLAQARANIDAALPNVSSTGYTPENATATVEGVLFWDVLHGQRGAPNGVELHPVTFFQVGSVNPPPPPPPPPTTTTVPPVTTGTVPVTTAPPVTTSPAPAPKGDDAADELPGCVTFPGRVYFHHVKQDHCAANFFVTP